MSLFGKKNQKEAGTIEMPIVAQFDAVSYDSALEYLLGLSDSDFTKFSKVVNINRTANKDTAKVLGIKPQPTTFLKDEVEYAEPANPATPPNDDSSFLDDDLETAFLEDDEKVNQQKAAAKPKEPVSS